MQKGEGAGDFWKFVGAPGSTGAAHTCAHTIEKQPSEPIFDLASLGTFLLFSLQTRNLPYHHTPAHTTGWGGGTRSLEHRAPQGGGRSRMGGSRGRQHSTPRIRGGSRDPAHATRWIQGP